MSSNNISRKETIKKRINSIISLYIKANYDLIKSWNADEDANDAKSWETKEDRTRARVYSKKKNIKLKELN